MYWLDGTKISTSLQNKPKIKIYTVDTKYVYADGTSPTQSGVDSVYKHELGHKKYYECLDFKTIDTPLSGCICNSDLDLLGKKVRANDSVTYLNMRENANEKYHAKYGRYGYPSVYECP
jgi:hypothetical protein